MVECEGCGKEATQKRHDLDVCDWCADNSDKIDSEEKKGYLRCLPDSLLEDDLDNYPKTDKVK